ncbi:hypothetical protein lerEdw1_008897 [Lerista edwardsae]|nr:hypothetical protein lerEdw1_008897 [Lerista edwardsae]
MTTGCLPNEASLWRFYGGKRGPCLRRPFLWRRSLLPFLAGERGNMPEWPLLRALRGGPGTRSLSLDARRLRDLPCGLGYIKGLESLSLRDNRLHRLPRDIQALTRLTVINLGNNVFEEVPEQLKYLQSLKKLYLFGNQVAKISPEIFEVHFFVDGLQNLVLLNLNNNQLSFLPPEIRRLENLECVSLDNNQLKCIPKEFCCLQKLHELHLSHNSIIALPEEIGNLTKLKVLILSRNQIQELPDGLCKLKSLQVLDVAGNNIQAFPKAMDELELKELYCEDNPLLEKRPVYAIQEEDILTLKEITARFIFTHLKNNNLSLDRAIKQNSKVQYILSGQRDCAHCGCGFLNMWLECVQFVAVKQSAMCCNVYKVNFFLFFFEKQMKTSRNVRLLPIRALLCSYKCFNRRDRDVFGIAVP